MLERDFIAFEYKTKSVKAIHQTKVIDMYESFGWEVTTITPAALDGVTLSLKMDRKQKHKHELTKLERQAEDLFDTVNSLERAKTMGAKIFSYIFGVIATLVLGGGMSLVLLIENSIPALVGGIVLGIAGIVLCSVNYLIYKKIAEKKTKQLLPVIDENEEKLANVLEKGNDLLRRDFI